MHAVFLKLIIPLYSTCILYQMHFASHNIVLLLLRSSDDSDLEEAILLYGIQLSKQSRKVEAPPGLGHIFFLIVLIEFLHFKGYGIRIERGQVFV